VARRFVFLKGLAERIAARQQPPQAPADRAQWQQDYVARSQAGTDIRSTSGEVGASGVRQEQMNAMTPAERMARLRQIASQPVAAHYHVLPDGRIGWGHGGAGTRPVRPGDRLIAYRGVEKRPTEMRVHSLLDTHLGQGMRVVHPDKVHEDMHGAPLHPMHLASAPHVAPPHPLPLARKPVLLKSEGARRANARKHKVVARPIRHSPALGREGRDRRGSDAWYHAGFLLAHEPGIAHACGLHDDAQGGDGGDGDGGGALAQSLPDGLVILAKAWFNRRHVSRPGSRGGRFYYDQHGEVVYGERPGLHFREAQPGDHALVRQPPEGTEAHPGGHHATIGSIEGNSLGLRYSEGGSGTVAGGDLSDRATRPIMALAPGHHQGDELPPEMQARLPGEPPQGAGALRRRMIADPQPGDRAAIGDGSPATVHRVDDEEVGLRDDTGALYRMPRTHWQRSLEEHARPLPPDPALAGRQRPAGETDQSPRQLAVEAMRDALATAPEAAPDPADTSGDYPARAQLRHAMRERPWPGDIFAAATPVALDGNDYAPGTGYTAAYVEDGEVELCDHWGNPAGTLDMDAWQRLLGRAAIIPMKRGEPPADDPDLQVPGVGVFGVFDGKVAKEEVKAAWEGTFAGGYRTITDTLAEDVGKVMAAGSILAPDGQHVGQFERHILRDGRGNVTVEHALMEVNQDMRVGFADAFNAQAEAHYRRWGVAQITVYADISVGKYCWAQQGYTFATEAEREAMIDRFDGWCKAHGHTIPDNTLVQMQHPWDIAGYTGGGEVAVRGHPRTRGGTDWAIDGTFPLGKAFFLADDKITAGCSGSWHGVKVLDDPDHPTARQARRYRQGKGAR
jgi:hypothetical protein